MVKSFKDSKIGAMKAVLSEHMTSEEVEAELDRYPSQAIIGLGQGGGRIAAELSRFGYPTYLLNSSKSDMEEHKHLIPSENRIVTKSENYPELEGTDKDAQLGYEIAVENKDKYRNVALQDNVQEAEFVWVCVSLGGGTGNGALKVALTYLSKVRKSRQLPGGNIPLGVICSLPSSDERGSSFRKNAMAGIALLQNFINNGEIGSVLVIDNEKMKDYYANTPLETYGGTQIDAKSYSNMVVASILAEISVIPLFNGRSVLDKTELLSTLSTPGWLSISKKSNIASDDNLEKVINELFTKNEVLANYEMKNTLAGAIAVLYPSGKNVSPKIGDDVYRYTSELLNSKVNLSISLNSAIKNLTLYGMAVLPTPSVRIQELQTELKEWEEKEKELERAKKEAAAGLSFGEFDDFFSGGSKKVSREKVNLDDLDDVFGGSSNKEEKVKASDLDDIDF